MSFKTKAVDTEYLNARLVTLEKQQSQFKILIKRLINDISNLQSQVQTLNSRLRSK